MVYPSLKISPLRAVLLAISFVLLTSAHALSSVDDRAHDAEERARVIRQIENTRRQLESLKGRIEGLQAIITQWDLVTRRFYEYSEGTRKYVASCHDILSNLDEYVKEHPTERNDPEISESRSECLDVVNSSMSIISEYSSRLDIIKVKIDKFRDLLDLNEKSVGNKNLRIEILRKRRDLIESLDGLGDLMKSAGY